MPEPDFSTVLGDAALAFALGAALALVFAAGARLIAWRPPTPWEKAVRTITGARALMPEERAFVLVAALSRLAADITGTPASPGNSDGAARLDQCLNTRLFSRNLGAGLAAALYRPGAANIGDIEREVLNLIARRGK